MEFVDDYGHPIVDTPDKIYRVAEGSSKDKRRLYKMLGQNCFYSIFSDSIQFFLIVYNNIEIFV